MLTVRYPRFDFASCLPHWAPHLEFAQYFNAVSMVPCALEPFAIKVFNHVKDRLDPVKDAALIREVDWFVAQEAQHFRQHVRFNKCFQTDRYPKMAELDRRLREEVDAFLADKSIEFCLGYIEGFEAFGAIWCRMWFEDLDEYKQDATEAPLALFDWHYAEEFEHRESAFKLYEAIAVRGSLWRRIYYGWFYRIWITRFVMQHLTRHTHRARHHLLEMDRAEMSPEDRAASVAREEAMLARIGALLKRRVRVIYSPFYNPARKRCPAGLGAVLESVAHVRAM
ncbi:MAG: metal-dependent hydrolase [Sphingomonas sp.]